MTVRKYFNLHLIMMKGYLNLQPAKQTREVTIGSHYFDAHI